MGLKSDVGSELRSCVKVPNTVIVFMVSMEVKQLYKCISSDSGLAYELWQVPLHFL